MKYITPIALGIALLGSGLATGCAREVAHRETDRPNLLGGRTHEESTVYENPDGSYTTEKSKTRTNP
jgi:hypothetical protein